MKVKSLHEMEVGDVFQLENTTPADYLVYNILLAKATPRSRTAKVLRVGSTGSQIDVMRLYVYGGSKFRMMKLTKAGFAYV
jgi:hypothetical protein